MRHRAGVALLEVLIALVILTSAGLGFVELVGTGLRLERDAVVREQTVMTEDRLVAALTLLKRGELDQRLGRRRIGEFIVDIQRPERTLYRIAVLPTGSPQVEHLVTVVYRVVTP